MCEPQVGNEGMGCTDPADLCTVNKTCTSGTCDGGTPKDCSAQTVGCFNGVCDTTTGLCTQQPVPPGGACAQGDSACTAGQCDMNGMCVPQPVNEGLSCNDGNPCTMGSTCTNGVCGNGAPVTQCMSNDACCPAGCTEAN